MTTQPERSPGLDIVVVGAGFAGLGAAYTLRKRLPDAFRVTVVAPSPRFIFGPSLIWTPFTRTVQDASFELGPVLSENGINFVCSHVHSVDVESNTLVTDEGTLYFDQLVIATGGTPDSNRIPGLAGELRATSWIVGEDSAMEVGGMLDRLIASPGPLVVGCAPRAAYYSAAYELALLIDDHLRENGVRDRVPMTFVTAEPYIGHLGFGQSAAKRVLKDMLTERNIALRAGVEIERISRSEIVLSTDEKLPVAASIIMPPFTGAVDIWKNAGLTSWRGFVPITARYQHIRYSNVYAAGIAARFTEAVPPFGMKVPPQTGYLSSQMGRVAAENLTASLGYGSSPAHAFPELADFRIIDGGSAGALLTSTGTHVLHHTARRLWGTAARELKEAAEQFLLWRLRTGRVEDLARTFTREQPVGV